MFHLESRIEHHYCYIAGKAFPEALSTCEMVHTTYWMSCMFLAILCEWVATAMSPFRHGEG